MMLRRVLISGYAFPCSKVDHTGILTEFLAGQQLFHNRRQHVIHVSGQQTAGSARAGDQFFLVQALGNFLHPYGCQVMVTVRILLKPGQVIKGRCGDFLSPAADRRDTGISCRLAVLVKFQGIPAVAEIFHMPHLYYFPVLAEADEYGPAVCGNVIFPFPVPSAYRCQYRGLYPSKRVVPETDRLADGIARIDSKKPVGLVAAVCRQKQVVEQAARTKVFHAFGNGFVRQGGDPQAEARFPASQKTIKIPEQHFPLAGSVGCRNNGVTRIEHPGYHLQLEHRIDVGIPSRVRLYMPYRQKRRRQQWEVLPLHPCRTGIFRHRQGKHVAVCPCYHVSVSAHISVLFSVSSQNPCYLSAHIGLVSHYRYHILFPFNVPYRQERHGT